MKCDYHVGYDRCEEDADWELWVDEAIDPRFACHVHVGNLLRGGCGHWVLPYGDSDDEGADDQVFIFCPKCGKDVDRGECYCDDEEE